MLLYYTSDRVIKLWIYYLKYLTSLTTTVTTQPKHNSQAPVLNQLLILNGIKIHHFKHLPFNKVSRFPVSRSLKYILFTKI